MRPEVATCSFSEFNPKMGTPVRTSRGFPRWKLRYPLELKLPELMPDAHTLRIEDKARFTDLYVGKLDTIGIDGIQEKIDALLASIGGGPAPLVMLCFEKLHEPGKWCHRTIFGRWYAEKTGMFVPELGATEPLPRKPKSEPAAGQSSIF